jgi:hypothetical protein
MLIVLILIFVALSIFFGWLADTTEVDAIGFSAVASTISSVICIICLFVGAKYEAYA